MHLEALEILRQQEIRVENDSQSIQSIAEENKVSPSDIYRMLTGTDYSGPSPSGKGYGQLTLQQVAQDLNISVNRALEILKEQGITTTKETSIRGIVQQYGKRPFEIVEMLKNRKD